MKMNNIDRQYKELLEHILRFGVDKQDRTGTGTKSLFGWQIRHRMEEGFPLLTTKKMAWKSIVTELLWFLRGDTNIKFLHDNDCHIWDGDYNKSGRTDGELGPIYGKQWRKWGGKKITSINLEKVKPYKWGMIMDMVRNGEDVSEYGVSYETSDSSIDQIANLISELKTNPDSRRLMVNAWNVGELDQMTLPPCHFSFQVYTRELSYNERERIALQNSTIMELCKIHGPMTPKGWDDYNIPTRAISLMWNQRSVDTFLGLPFNIASYGLLLEIIADEVNMVPEELIGNLGDVHLYANHIEQAKEQLGRQPFGLPKLNIKPTLFEFGKPDPSKLDLDYYSIDNFELTDYKSHPVIKAPLSN